MNSEQQSFREIYGFPQQQLVTEKGKRRHRRKQETEKTEHKAQSFDRFVRKTKNVVLFAQKLKQQIGRNHIFDMHTLTQKQLQYLENQSTEPAITTCFDNENKFVVAVQVVVLLILIFYAWKSTYEIAFLYEETLVAVNYLTMIILAVHVGVFCMTQYKTDMYETLTECRQIWKIYVKQKCAKDIATIILIILQTSRVDFLIDGGAVPAVLRLITFYLVFQRIRQSARKIQDAFVLSTNSQTFVALLKLVSQLFMLLHFVSILLNIMSDLEALMGRHNTWVKQQNFETDSDFQKYIAGFYWAVTILSSVGGNVFAANYVERLIVSILGIICCMSFGYFVSMIGSLIKTHTERDEKYQKENRSLNRYLSNLTLTHDLRLKIRGHFLNRHKVERTLDSGSEQVVLESLNTKLRNSLLAENNTNILKKISQFEKFKPETLTSLAQIIKRVIFAPEHIIYSNKTEERKLWLIDKGSVNEYTNNFENCAFEKQIAEYDQNSPVVGWINFITQNKYKSTTKATQLTVAYELDQHKFRTVLLNHPKDYYRIMEMKQLLIESKKKYVHKCMSCDRYTHNVINCPRIHYIRRDVISMANQIKRMEKFRLGLSNKKYKRELLRDNWKVNFKNAQLLGKTDMIQGKHEEKKSLSMTIEYFLKKLNNFQSQKSISNKHIRRQGSISSRVEELQQTQNGDRSQNYSITSEWSGSTDGESVKPDPFEVVLMDQDNKQYFPHHNIEQLLREYNNHMKGKSFKDISHNKIFTFKKDKERQ